MSEKSIGLSRAQCWPCNRREIKMGVGHQRNIVESSPLGSVDSQHPDFLACYAAEARPPLIRAIVQQYRSVLESAGLVTASIKLRLSAIPQAGRRSGRKRFAR